MFQVKHFDVYGLPDSVLLTEPVLNTAINHEENDCCYICQNYTANERLVTYEGYWDNQYILVQNHAKTYCSSCRNWYYTHQQAVDLRAKAEKVLERKTWMN